MLVEIKKWLNLVAFSHSIFALPFAMSSFLLAKKLGVSAKDLPDSIWVIVMLIIIAILSARMAAMSFNRLVDAKFDSANRRTQTREIPSGVISKKKALVFCFANIVIFLTSAFFLGEHCFVPSFPIILILLSYSYVKRFSASVHLILGLSLSLAPGATWWVLRPQMELQPLILMLAVMFWVSGFDILYSTQDFDFDRKQGLYSIPVKFGIARSLKISFFSHILSCSLLLVLGLVSDQLSLLYYMGLIPICALLLSQHWLITSNDLSRVNKAFFTFNGAISVLYFGLIVIAL